MSLSKKVGYGVVLAGALGVSGCGKSAVQEPIISAVSGKKDTQCQVVVRDKKRPDPVCGVKQIKDSVGQEVRLGMAVVICSNGDLSDNQETRVDVSCDSPLWSADQANGIDINSVCLHYTGCEKGHMIIRPDTGEGGSWELRQ